MKFTLTIICVFATGIAVGLTHVLPETLPYSEATTIILYILIAQIGFSLGSSPNLKDLLKEINLKNLLIPIGTIAGTLIFSLITGCIIGKHSPGEWLALGSGLGYYSLSSVLILDLKTSQIGLQAAQELATLAIFTNIIREILSISLIPIIARKFDAYAAVSATGVCSLDVALPFIERQGGKRMVAVSVLHGAVLELCVPLLVTLFCMF